MEFYDRIKDQVTEITKHYQYQNDGTAFGHFAIKECFSKIIDFEFDGADFDEFIQDHIVDRANDLGNDAIFTNQKSNEILIFQFKYSKNSLLDTNEIKKNKNFIDWLTGINGVNLKPNSRVQRVIDEEIKKILTPENLKKKNYSIILYYIDNHFDNKLKSDIKALYKNYQQQNIDLPIKFYNFNDLQDFYDDIEIPKNEIELSIVPNEHFIKKVNYFENNSETPTETIVTSVKANSLKPIIEEKKELILALNVRYYKGENEINTKIKDEYQKGDKSNFWTLNNGINAICEDFNLIDDKLKIKNFQIVNGGQTVKTLSRLVMDLPDNVQILMRLTKITEKKRISKISMAIAIASNSQNAISSRDLRSGDRIQRHIYGMLDAKGIFYDKKDGEWGTIRKKNKYQNPENTRTHLRIYNTDLGKSYMSFFLQIPISTKGRNKLVFSDIYYDDIFSMTENEDKQFYKLILSYRISEFISVLKHEKQYNYEILQNTYVNDVLLSLSALYFYKDNLGNVGTIEKLKSKLQEFEASTFIDDNGKFSLALSDDFESFMIKIISALQNRLDVKKEAKLEYTSEEWIPNDTNKWLKKDGTYKEIFEKVIIKLKQ